MLGRTHLRRMYTRQSKAVKLTAQNNFAVDSLNVTAIAYPLLDNVSIARIDVPHRIHPGFIVGTNDLAGNEINTQLFWGRIGSGASICK